MVRRRVTRAHWWSTTPTVIVQPVSGFWIMPLAGYSVTAPMLTWSLALYLLAMVVWLQLTMRDMAQSATCEGRSLPVRY